MTGLHQYTHTGRHAGAHTFAHTTKQPFFSRVAVHMGGCQCHLTVKANNTQHIRGRRPAGHHSAKHVKHPAESKRLLELPINASTSESEPWGSESVAVNTQPPDDRLHHHIITTTLNTTPCLSSPFSLSFLLPSPPYALQPRLYLHITFHPLRGNRHSSHQLAGPGLHSGTQTERLGRQRGT